MSITDDDLRGLLVSDLRMVCILHSIAALLINYLLYIIVLVHGNVCVPFSFILKRTYRDKFRGLVSSHNPVKKILDPRKVPFF